MKGLFGKQVKRKDDKFVNNRKKGDSYFEKLYEAFGIKIRMYPALQRLEEREFRYLVVP